MKNVKRKFTSEFKLRVILDALREKQILSELSQKYQLHSNQISLWKQDFLNKALKVMPSKQDKVPLDDPEKKELYTKIGQLQMEVDFFKKKVVMIPRDERYKMFSLHENLSIRKQCELLYISRTKYYYKPQTESLINLHIMKLMDEQYQKTPFYGFPRIYEFVKRACPTWILNKKRVEKLYKKMDLRSVLPGPNTSKTNPEAVYKFPYLLKKLKIGKVNQQWASDITYIPMPRGYMYLYAVIGLYGRFIVNWGLSINMSADWCVTITR
jgi:putative transposase